ncbi:MAG: D-isomer specific 2-hydroxyacid dehydrogenase family protein [Actinomycetota bacterium]
MTAPRIAIGPTPSKSATEAVRAGGGEPTGIDAAADAIVWLAPGDTDGLRQALDAAPSARWVQLPMAGVERVAAAGVFDTTRVWTSAKGSYAEPVAEHALALALAGLRVLGRRAVARSWGTPAGLSLYGERVTILGAGGITDSLLELLAPFRVRATVVRRTPEPAPGAERTWPQDRLHEALSEARVVFLALALTPSTDQIIGSAELAAMLPDAWLVNVARGRHIDTDALVAALKDGVIGGAALDVTDPEPLPDGHPLWDLENCLITPHTANTWQMATPLLAQRITDNVARFAAGQPLVGLVDPESGY